MNRPDALRVLVAHSYRGVGGPDTFVMNLVRAVSPRGVHFSVLLAQDRPLASALRDLGAEVIVDGAVETLPRSLSPVRLAAHFRRAGRIAALIRGRCRRDGIRVVHCTHESAWTVLGQLRAPGVARVASIHGLRFLTPPWAGRLNIRWLDRSTDRLICVSETVRQAFLDAGVAAAKLDLVRSSVDLARFRLDLSGARVRAELSIALDAPLIGAVGSIDERKGQEYFIDAAAEVATRHAALRAVIVGGPRPDGPPAQVAYLAELRRRASSLGLDGRLIFVPARPDIPDVMAALDVLVQPSLTEAGPRAPLEAMAMARPVVGTRVEGLAEEVVEGATGLLVPPRDARALAAAIDTLLDDPARRARMGQAGRARVERFYSLDTTAETVAALYRDAANAHAG